MVHHLVLCKLHSEVTDEYVEWIMRETRVRLLKIHEVRAIRCGKQIELENTWGYFFSVDYESMDKMAVGHATPTYRQFVEEVINPYIIEQLTFSYEMEPGRDVRYS
jgi:hypothetical protein